MCYPPALLLTSLLAGTAIPPSVQSEDLNADSGTQAAWPDSNPLLAAVRKDLNEGRLESALNRLHPLAIHGHAEAQALLGALYYLGRGVARARPIAFHWIRRAAEQGWAPAQHYLGNLYYTGEVGDADRQLAHHWYERSASQGWGPARQTLDRWDRLNAQALHEENLLNANRLIEGTLPASPPVHRQAIPSLAKGSAAPAPLPAIERGIPPEYAAPCQREPARGRRAASSDPNMPCAPIEEIQLSGQLSSEAGPDNGSREEPQIRPALADAEFADLLSVPTKPQDTLLTAPVTGQAPIAADPAQRTTAGSPHFADPGEDNFDQARSHYETGLLYAMGSGVPQDAVLAFHWFARAAKQGYPPAQYRLGMAYMHGTGVSANTYEAKRWLERSALQRYTLAQRELALLYVIFGEPQDLVRAYAWSTAAAATGTSEDREMLDRLAASMNPETLKQGKALAQQLLRSLQER